jgi:hypothetical protein
VSDIGIPSFGLEGIKRDVASANSGDADLSQMEKDLGISNEQGKPTIETDDQGKYLDPMKDKTATDISKYVGMHEEKQKELAAPKPAADGKKPSGEPYDFSTLKEDPNSLLTAAAGGVFKGVQNTYNAGLAVADAIENKIGKTNLLDFASQKATWADDIVPEPTRVAPRVVQGAAQFMTMFIPGSGVVKAVGMTGAAASLTAGAAADALAFEGNKGRLTDALKDIPIIGDLAIPYLVTKPDDTELEGRFKNAVEGMGLGVLTDGLIHAVSWMKGAKVTGEAVKVAQEAESAPLKGAKSVPEIAASEKKAIDPNLKITPDITPQEVVNKGAKAAIDEKTAKAFEARKRGVIPDSELDRVSQESNVKLDDLFKTKAGTPFNAEQMNVLNRYHAAAHADFDALSKQAAENPTPEVLGKFYESAQAFSAIHTLKKAGSSENARALRLAQGATSQVTADPEMLKDFLAMTGERDIQQIAYFANNMPKELHAEIAQLSYKRKLSEAAAEVFRQNLLASPKTHVTNFISNMGFFGLNIAERGLGANLGKGVAKEVAPAELKAAWAHGETLSKIDTSAMSYEQLAKHEAEISKNNQIIKKARKSSIEPGEATQMLYGTYNGFYDGVRALFKSADQEGKTLSELVGEATGAGHGDKFSQGGGGYNPKLTSEKVGGGKAIDILGGIQRLPGKGLAWADDFWKFVNVRAETHAQGYRMAKKMGLSGSEQADFITNFVKNPPEDVLKEAQQFAKVNTFQEELGGVAKTFNNLLDKIDNKIDLHLTGFLVPFRQAPANIAVQGFERSPLAVMGKRYKDAVAAGGAAAQIEKAKFAMGSAFFGTSVALAAQGMMTSKGPSDYRMRRELEQAGWKPYSLKLETTEGTKYIPITKLEPIGSVIGMAADIHEVFSERGTDNPDYARMAHNTVLAVYNLMTPEMLTDTMGKVFDALEDPKAGSNFVSRIASKTVPLIGYSNALRSTGMLDDVQRQTKINESTETFSILKEAMNEIRNQVPGLSASLPPKKNVFGEDMPVASGWGAVLSPFAANNPKDTDAVMKEIISLGYSTELDKHDLPDGEKHLTIDYPSTNIKIANGMVELNTQQHAKYVELGAGIGLEKPPYPGKTLKEALGEIISGGYKALGNHKTDQNKRVLIKSIVTSYRQAAKYQMLKEFPDIQDKLNKSRESFINARVGVEEAQNVGDQ